MASKADTKFVVIFSIDEASRGYSLGGVVSWLIVDSFLLLRSSPRLRSHELFLLQQDQCLLGQRKLLGFVLRLLGALAALEGDKLAI